MSEILILLESIAAAARFVLVAMVIVSFGFLVFDRSAVAPRAEDKDRSPDRMAA